MAAVTTVIDQGWRWKQRDAAAAVSVLDELSTGGRGWSSATAYPSEVHVELLAAGRIPDPFLAFNEHEVQCECLCSVWSYREGRKARGCGDGADGSAGIGDAEWLYATSFDVSEEELARGYAMLVFEGLDTLCDIYLVRLPIANLAPAH